MIELLVSVAVLAIISVSVSSSITRSRMREELDASARTVAGTLRNIQAQALAAQTVKTCMPSSVAIVCELGTGPCGVALCGTPAVPFAVGATFKTNASAISEFAEVDLTLENRREAASGLETFARMPFADAVSGAGAVKIQSLIAGGVSVATASVAFERQSGTMRINACGTPAGAPSCGAGTEPVTLDIVLQHARLGATAVIRLNRLTGRVSID